MSSSPPTNAPSSRPSAAGEGRPARRWWLWLLALPFVSCFWFGSAGVFAVLLNIPEGSTLAKWDQPPNRDYGTQGPYQLYVRENSSWWNVMGRNRHCGVGVVSRAHEGGVLYGHWTEYEFHNDHNDPGYFAQCVISWEPDGVSITEPTGHRLFIPKTSFIGGR